MKTYKFNTVWPHVKRATGWKNQSELANFLGIAEPSVSGAKKEGIFREKWLKKITEEFETPISELAGEEVLHDIEKNQYQSIDYMSNNNLGLSECVELLAKIYNTGDTELINAIVINLKAINETITNKNMVQSTIDTMEKMNKRMQEMKADKERLEAENEMFRKRLPDFIKSLRKS